MTRIEASNLAQLVAQGAPPALGVAPRQHNVTADTASLPSRPNNMQPHIALVIENTHGPEGHTSAVLCRTAIGDITDEAVTPNPLRLRSAFSSLRVSLLMSTV
ncbi:hypothetical protein PLESTB_000309200 [Pleodorina starrii]|uniref:Uncharacterized protein n=1 Tax=Pleodorina starrii TaxID=330485 RepID=A0A9W6BDZ5_9CHLO|nr:hypothetical protein PLESTM_001719600 [Pleodorina starrii]GLC49791.1 hypothetical protein PLESTB_000309200 [Pleodorina starrii]